MKNERTLLGSLWVVLGVSVFLTSYVYADVRWLPSPQTLAHAVCASDAIELGRLTDVEVQVGVRARTGTGVLRIESLIQGKQPMTARLNWSDQNSEACPRLEWDQRANQRGVWFVCYTAEGSIDPARTEFWRTEDVRRFLNKAALSQDATEALRQAVE